MTPSFDTFEELVAAAKEQGATHMTMSNWHEGAFWKYQAHNWYPYTGEKKAHDVLRMAEITKDIFNKPRYGRTITHMAHFIDSTDNPYHDWDLYDWFDCLGIYEQPLQSFIPINQAVTWYKSWNYCLAR